MYLDALFPLLTLLTVVHPEEAIFAFPFTATPTMKTGGGYDQGPDLKSPEWKDTERRSDRDVSVQISLIFPESVKETPKDVGDGCVLPDGEFGFCKPLNDCSFYMHYTSTRASKLSFCRSSSKELNLICCPGNGKKTEGLVNEPTSHHHHPYHPSKTNCIPPSRTNSIGSTTPITVPITEQAVTPEQVTARPGTTTALIPILTTTISGDDTFTSLEISTVKPTVTTQLWDAEDEVSLTSTIDLAQFNMSSQDAQNACGAYDAKHQQNWPWIVSIGREHISNNTTEWLCLGSLITTEYILTTAYCLQGSPNVIAVGTSEPLIGRTSTNKLRTGTILPIGEIRQIEKYVFPTAYKNLGLIKLRKRITVSAQTSPVCLPFPAGVLEIISFSGHEVYSLRRARLEDTYTIKQRRYKVLKNKLCSLIVKKFPQLNISGTFPYGVKLEVMCAIARGTKPLCPIEGAPVVIMDASSNSYVQIGIQTGHPSCSNFRTKMMFSSRVNSFISWLRSAVGDLPSPLPCYV